MGGKQLERSFNLKDGKFNYADQPSKEISHTHNYADFIVVHVSICFIHRQKN